MWVTKTLTLKCPNEGAWLTRLRVDDQGEVVLNGYTGVDDAVRAQQALKVARKLVEDLDESDQYDTLGPELRELITQLRTVLAELGPVDLVDEAALPSTPVAPDTAAEHQTG